MTKKTTYNIPKGLSKNDWKQEHLEGKHEKYLEYFAWCPLCMNKQADERKKEEFEGTKDLGISVSEKQISHDVGPGQK